MIEYFKANQVDLPTVAPVAADGANHGFVTPSFESGALLVANEAGRVTRLSWEDPSQKERRRALAPGIYVLRSYRLIRKDKGGKEWYLSATGHDIKTFTVLPGKQTRVAIQEAIVLKQGLKLGRGQANVSMGFQGENHSGLTVYSAGKRIPVNYSLLNSAGEEVASGSMSYG